MQQARRYIIALILFCALVPAYLTSRSKLQEHSNQSIPFEQRDSYNYPSVSVLRAAFLNYSSFASSLHWVSGLIYFGDWRYTKTKVKPQHLQDYAHTIQQLDPEFYNVYEWFNATYLSSRTPEVSYEDLKLVEDFMQQGMEQFPTQASLPYTTGLLSLGFSKNRTPEQRLDEYTRGIHFLEICAKLKGCPDTAPFTIAYLYRRKQELEAELGTDGKPAEQNAQSLLALYKELYPQTMDDQLRKQLEQSMLNLGMSKQEIKDLDRGQIDQMRQHFESTHSYLPLDLWTQVVYPTGSSQELLLKSTQE